MSLGAVIRVLRRQKGMTQQQLADAVEVSKRSVVRVEKGEQSITMDTFGRYADALGMRPSDLLRQSEAWSETNLSGD
ncbi:helix-turn-helix domain-containing protein [Corynebacterium variabile]|nr:helix-turn-helix transcriptional regulator [Corynebacterium variabile]